MKIVIDITEDAYKRHKWRVNSDMCTELDIAVAKGKPLPSNATNGDIIKALFPKIDDNFSNVIDLKLWWNAKYKAEKSEKKTWIIHSDYDAIECPNCGWSADEENLDFKFCPHCGEYLGGDDDVDL